MDDDELYTRDALAMGSDTRPPVLFRGYYRQWKSRFLVFINVHDLGKEMIQSIREGPAVFMLEIPAAPENDPPIVAVRRQKDPSEYTPQEKNRVKADILALSYLIRGLTDDIFAFVDSHETAKSMWDELEKQHGTTTRSWNKETGTRMAAWNKETNILTSFENFKAREGELLESTYNRYCNLLNELRKNYIPKSNLESNIKFLNNLRPEWKSFTTSIVQNKDLTNLSIHMVYEYLNQNQDEVLEIAQAQKSAEKAGRRLKNSSRSLKQEKIISSSSSSDIEGSSSEAETDIQDLTNAIALLTKAFHQNTFRKQSSNKLRYSSSSKGKEKVEGRKYEEKKPEYTRYAEKKDIFMKPNLKITGEVVKCFNCGKPGHYARECRKPVDKNFMYYNKFKLAEKREAGKALMIEDHWLDSTSDDEDDEDLPMMCLTAIVMNDEDGDCSEEDKDLHCSESISKVMVTTSDISHEGDPAEIL